MSASVFAPSTFESPASRTARGAVLACAWVLLSATAAKAIPTNPDPAHTAAATPWANVGLLNPAVDQHQHLTADNLFGLVDSYKTYSVWDDNQYRYNAAMDRTLTKALDNQDFGHGYMQIPATFEFLQSVFPLPAGVMPFPLWAKNIILNQVRNIWENAVNGVGVNVNNVPVSAQIKFIEAAGADIKIKFDLTYPTDAIGGTGTFPVENLSNFDSMGNYIGPSLPALPGGAPQGGRDRVLAFWTPSLRRLTFNSNIDWYQVPNDVAAANGGTKFDFQSVALHEWGHVLGLHHPDGILVPAANIMTGAPQLKRMAGVPQGINHGIDFGSSSGARNLYTIALQEAPCPPTCGDGDSCCPSGCDAGNDSDCAALLPVFSPGVLLLLSGLMALTLVRAARRKTARSRS